MYNCNSYRKFTNKNNTISFLQLILSGEDWRQEPDAIVHHRIETGTGLHTEPDWVSRQALGLDIAFTVHNQLVDLESTSERGQSRRQGFPHSDDVLQGKGEHLVSSLVFQHLKHNYIQHLIW